MTNNITGTKILELRTVNSFNWVFWGYKHVNSYLLYTTDKLFYNPKFQKIVYLLQNLIEMWHIQLLSQEEVNEKILNIPNNTMIQWIKELPYQDEYIKNFLSIELYSTNPSEEEKQRIVEYGLHIPDEQYSELYKKFWEALAETKAKVKYLWTLSDLLDFSLVGEDGAFLQEVLRVHEKIVECINENKDVCDFVEGAHFVGYY